LLSVHQGLLSPRMGLRQAARHNDLTCLTSTFVDYQGC
jgi:hypothetical protein